MRHTTFEADASLILTIIFQYLKSGIAINLVMTCFYFFLYLLRNPPVEITTENSYKLVKFMIAQECERRTCGEDC